MGLEQIESPESVTWQDLRPDYPSTILFVDDEDVIRDLMARRLSLEGYNALTAGSGKEALRIYREKQHEISLAILDLAMPEMDGKQCLDEILKINPQAKVLIASGYVEVESGEPMLENGARAFIGKPFDMGEVLHTVRQVLDEQ